MSITQQQVLRVLELSASDNISLTFIQLTLIRLLKMALRGNSLVYFKTAIWFLMIPVIQDLICYYM